MPPIPANLFLGFLGVGKTTAVIDLLKRKDPREKWAVLVNEYGTVSVDDAFIEGEAAEGVSVRSVAGGCFCCTTAPMLPVALHFLLQEMRPDRLIIETSGLGHPAALVDTLREKYSDRIELRASVGFVTPSDFAAPGMIDSNPVFRDQVQLADVLVLNKLDTATPQLVSDFQAWANSLFPSKLLVAATEQGRVEPAWLDLKGEPSSQGPWVPATTDLHPRPLRTGFAQTESRGYTFPPAVVFDESALLASLSRPEFVRLKGVFRCEHGWVSVNRAGGQTTVRPSAFRRESRLEVFAVGVDWEAFEREVSRCIHEPRPPGSGD